MRIVDPQTVFRYAEAYSQACGFLIPQYREIAQEHSPESNPAMVAYDVSDSAKTAPLTMVDSFALELYMKCLCAMDHNGAAPKGHKTKELYGYLNSNTKHRLRKHYVFEVDRSPLVPRLSSYERKKVVNFMRYLNVSSNAFEKSRYLYERELPHGPTPPSHGKSIAKPPEIMYMDLLRRAARKAILDIMPEWAAPYIPTPLPSMHRKRAFTKIVSGAGPRRDLKS